MSIETLATQNRRYASMAANVPNRSWELTDENMRQSMADFQGVEHRLEFVARVHGVDFINDSKATNVNAAWYALESMFHPVIWIAGGQDKGNDYEVLTPMVKDKVRAIVCMGKDNTKMHQAFAASVETMVDAQSAEEAVKEAYRLAKPGDVVLLSPACASFDLFKNYEERGNQFKRAVFDL